MAFLKRNFYPVLILFLGIILFVPFLGSVHLFDWDEANFAELAREMIVSKNYLQPQINFLPFYEKPPLFIWFQVLSMKLFGINEFAARFPNAICGIFVLITLFLIGKRHYGVRMGCLWSLCFGASIAPHFYFKTGLIDPLFNYFIFLAIYFFSFLILNQKVLLNSILSALFTALAVMTKGPVAFILIVGTLGFTWLILKFKNYKNLIWTFPWILIALGLSAIWFYIITRNYGETYVREFIEYQIRLFQTEDAKHGGTFIFHPIALLLGCFPASIWMWSVFNKSYKSKSQMQFILYKMMLSCGMVVLLVFTVVKTKIIHYSSMDYYPITFFAALSLDYLIEKNKKLPSIQFVLLTFIGVLWGIALIIVPYLGMHKEYLIPYIKDQNFINQLQTPIEWNLWASTLGMLYLLIFIIGLFNIKKQQMQRGILLIFISIIVLLESISIYYLPRIENMVQGAVIEFCQNIKKEDCNTQSLYIKSYNQFFYSKRLAFDNIEDTFKHLHYIYRPLQKDCYFILRTIDTANFDHALGPNSTKLYDKQGFTFYLRKR